MKQRALLCGLFTLSWIFLPAAADTGPAMSLTDGPEVRPRSAVVEDNPHFQTTVIAQKGDDGASHAVTPHPAGVVVVSQPDFNDTIAALGSTTATVRINGIATVTATVSVPEHITLEFGSSGCLTNGGKDAVTINGPLTAPHRQIFCGNLTIPGRVVYPKNMRAPVEWMGANPDGATASASAFEATSKALSVNCGTLVMSRGTYVFGGSFASDTDSHLSYTTGRTCVSWVGQGKGLTFLKLAGGENAAHKGGTGPNFIGNGAARPPSDMLYTGFTCDFNGTENLLSSPDQRSNGCLTFANGARTTVVEHVGVINDPGNNPLAIGITSAAGQGEIKIRHIYMANNGSCIPGNYNIDHSGVYVNGDGVKVENIYGECVGSTTTGTMVEVHASNATVQHVRSFNYLTGFVASPDIQDLENLTVRDVYVENVQYAIQISTTAYKYNRISIDRFVAKQNSTIEYGNGAYFINGSQSTAEGSVAIDRLEIANSHFYGNSKTNLYFMQVYQVGDLLFHHNTVNGFTSAYGIQVVDRDIGLHLLAQRIEISSNNFVDVSLPVYVYSAVPDKGFRQLDVVNNVFHSSEKVANPPIVVKANGGEGLVSRNTTSPTYTPTTPSLVVTGNGVSLSGTPSSGPSSVGSLKTSELSRLVNPSSLCTGFVSPRNQGCLQLHTIQIRDSSSSVPVPGRARTRNLPGR